jgi:hypothetical protein
MGFYPEHTVVSLIKIENGKEKILGSSTISGTVKVQEMVNDVYLEVTKYTIYEDEVHVVNSCASELGGRPSLFNGPSYKGDGWKVEKYMSYKRGKKYCG